MMDSSFLTGMSVALGFYSGLLFLKLLIQFGLPNHPARFTSYFVSFCVAFYFCVKASVALNLVSPWFWMKWRTLPLVTGSLALLLQAIMTIGTFSLIQQKVVSRIPLIAGLICFAFFPNQSEIFFALAVTAGCIFLSLSVGKARYQKRLFFKMSFFLGVFSILGLFQYYWLSVVGEVFLFFALFYFFLFEQSFAVSALLDEFKVSQEGVR